jgi:cation:H+ antiporter
MPEILIALSGGIVLLLFSTRTLIRLSGALSSSLKLSPLIIGMTVVAIGTSLPELSVSVIASARQDYSLAVGNIIGSNIINILLVFSVGILIGNLRVGTTKTPRNALILLLITFVYTYLQKFSIIPKQTLGILYISGAVILTYFEYRWALFGRTHEDSKKFKKEKPDKFTAGKIIMLMLSVTGVIAGGYFIVTITEKISSITGLSTGILGLTLTAIATSLPELLTTIFSQKDRDEKMTIGNIIGSNIYNLFLIGGIIDLFSVNASLTDINWFAINLTTIFFVLIILVYRGRIVPKWVGITSLFFFIVYMFLETNISGMK